METTLFTIVEWIAALAITTLVGLNVKQIASQVSRHEKLEDEFREFLITLPEKYVAKADYRADIDDIKSMLRDLTHFVHQQRRAYE